MTDNIGRYQVCPETTALIGAPNLHRIECRRKEDGIGAAAFSARDAHVRLHAIAFKSGAIVYLALNTSPGTAWESRTCGPCASHDVYMRIELEVN